MCNVKWYYKFGNQVQPYGFGDIIYIEDVPVTHQSGRMLPGWSVYSPLNRNVTFIFSSFTKFHHFKWSNIESYWSFTIKLILIFNIFCFRKGTKAWWFAAVCGSAARVDLLSHQTNGKRHGNCFLILNEFWKQFYKTKFQINVVSCFSPFWNKFD